MSAETFFKTVPEDWGTTLNALHAFAQYRPMMGLSPEGVQRFIVDNRLDNHAAMAVYLAFVFRERDEAKKEALRSELLLEFTCFANRHEAYGIHTIGMLLALLLLGDKQTEKLIVTAHATKVGLAFNKMLG
jgi:hypothetical protein